MPRRRRGKTKFVADAMLGSMARKLRAFGYDTVYFREGVDRNLLALAKSDGRVVLTSDRQLAELARVRGVSALLITGRREGDRIASLRTGAIGGRVRLEKGEPRCSVCNGGLLEIRRAEAAGNVPSSVEARHRLFYKCSECGRYYWRGSHWKKLRWLERRLGENLHGPLP